MDLFSRTNLLIFVLAAVSFFLLLSGVRALRLGSRTIYFRHRRQRVLAGWWMTGASLFLALIALLLYRARTPLLAPEPTAVVASASPVIVTPSRTPTSTPRPGITLTATATSTATPHLPISLEIMVVSSVTPQGSATISDIRFSEALDDNYPIGNRSEFVNPIARMYASFAYRHMTYGAQFTVLWFRNGELVFFESGPWQSGGRGGASVKWEPALHEWHQGDYEVQFFVGTQWKATGRFTLRGNPPTSTFTPTSSPTRTLRPAQGGASSPSPSETPRATPTR
jgi:hypothetical protein